MEGVSFFMALPWELFLMRAFLQRQPIQHVSGKGKESKPGRNKGFANLSHQNVS